MVSLDANCGFSVSVQAVWEPLLVASLIRMNTMFSMLPFPSSQTSSEKYGFVPSSVSLMVALEAVWGLEARCERLSRRQKPWPST